MSDQNLLSPTEGFPPIIGPGARVLVLGSLPSEASIRKQQYYGHPRNAFWPIMGELFGAAPDISYPERAQILVDNGVAVWDVLAASVRLGSMDAAIDPDTATANDIVRLLDNQPSIRLVCFNGKTAARYFERLVAPAVENGSNTLQYQLLPSTSPAHASMSFSDKLDRWRIVRDAANNKTGE